MSTMKKIKRHELTVEDVNEALTYDPDTGEFRWASWTHAKKVWKGQLAGTVDRNGYRTIRIYGTRYRAHQLAWFVTHGYWAKEIDHINHEKDDNRICNLREVTHAENSRNMKALKNTITGLQGIHYNRKRDRYTAVIKLNGKKVWQKTYKESELDKAIQDRQAKLLELGFHENHGK